MFSSSLYVEPKNGQVYVSESAIRRVLRAFCFYLPAVGYCQVRCLSAGLCCCLSYPV
jgi:hypothetical protein